MQSRSPLHNRRLKCAAVVLGITRSALAGASPEKSCAPVGLPWVSVQFEDGQWPKGLRESALLDLKADLSGHDIGCCRVDEAPRRPTNATIVLRLISEGSVMVSVEMNDDVTHKRLSRNVDLASVPSDGHPLAIAVATDELIWASWAEVALKRQRPVQAPPELVRGVQQSLNRRPARVFRLGGAAAIEHYMGSQTLAGADLVSMHDSGSCCRLRFYAGIRRGRTVPAADGIVRSTAARVGFAWGPALVRTDRLDVAILLGGDAAWVHFEGASDSGAHASSLYGVAAYLRSGPSINWHPTVGIWIGLNAGLGAPLRSVVATDAGRTVTGISGIELSTSLALMMEL